MFISLRIESARVRGSNKGKMCFSRFLKMFKDSAAWIEFGRSFRREQLKVRESVLVPLWDGTIKQCSLEEGNLLEGT